MKKIIFYLGHITALIKVNKVRNFLTGLGIYVAVLVFSMGLIISDSYYNSKFSVINEMEDLDVVVMSGEQTGDISQYASNKLSAFFYLDYIGGYKKIFCTRKTGNNKYVTPNGTIHGVSYNNSIYMYTDSDGNCITSSLKITEGREISINDITEKRHVAVIDEATADIIFPNESCIGKTITFNGNIGDVAVGSFDSNKSENEYSFIVIGVVENCEMARQKLSFARRDIQNTENSDVNNVFVDVSVYIPISLIYDLFQKEEINCYSVYRFKSESDLNSFSTFIEYKSKQNNEIKLYSKKIIKNNLVSELETTRRGIVIIALFLCVLSSISIMGIVLFSIKERIPEIGIRKAFGATYADIIFLIFSEVFLVAVAASIMAALSGYIICIGVMNILADYLNVYFKVIFDFSNILLAILIGTFESVSSIIYPCIWGSKLNVTDALRFE